MKTDWFSKRPVWLFIDTSAFRAGKFNFGPSYNTVRKAVEAGDVQIVATDISKAEFVKHAEEVLREDEQKLHKAGSIKTFFGDQLEAILKDIATQSGSSLWEKVSKEFKFQVIDAGVEWKAVFSDYFSKKPPFSSGKKNEFPDAFNMKILEANSPAHLAVISLDGDWVNWGKERAEVSIYSNIGEFAEAYLKIRDEIPYASVGSAIQSVRDRIVGQLREYFSDTDHYDLDDGISEVEMAEVVELHMVESILQEINHTQGSAVFNVRLRGKTQLDLHCPVVVWDSIDKEEITLGANSRQAVLNIEISASVTVFDVLGDHSTYDFEIDDEEIIVEDFSVPTEWTSFLDADQEDWE